MVSESEEELFKSKIDSCRVYGNRMMADLMLCTKYGNRFYGRCWKTQRVTSRLAMRFACSRCRRMMEGTVDSIQKLCDEEEAVNGL